MRGRAPFEVRPGRVVEPDLPHASGKVDDLDLRPVRQRVIEQRQRVGRRRGLFAGFEVEPDDDEFIERSDAELRVEVPLEAAENLAGPLGEQDAYILIHIDRQAIDAMDEPPLLVLPLFGLVKPS